jgi:hypothetical protein
VWILRTVSFRDATYTIVTWRPDFLLATGQLEARLSQACVAPLMREHFHREASTAGAVERDEPQKNEDIRGGDA